ncbi:MAG: hypothetical protein V4564_19075 [Pseudomonadota bacterium]|uniref:hypothetical protein n=1 Tax=Sphingomonas sp. ERG5 TaxID=1381597 RepID=UPI00054BA683|nr:hypothetical protein [Sphingomonas sp. ERG5]
MTDIDAMLARLRESPVHPGLETIDTAVMDALGARASAATRLNGTAFGVAAVMALVLGIVGSAYPASPARAASISPFGPPSALAPSTLLGADE